MTKYVIKVVLIFPLVPPHLLLMLGLRYVGKINLLCGYISLRLSVHCVQTKNALPINLLLSYVPLLSLRVAFQCARMQFTMSAVADETHKCMVIFETMGRLLI